MLEFCDWRRDSDVNIANRLDFRPALAGLAPISVNGIEIIAMHKRGVLLPEYTQDDFLHGPGQKSLGMK
jgi:hypothetical protein